MTKPRSLLTAALFALVTANAYVFFTQAASAESTSANSGDCSHVVKTFDYNNLTPEQYFDLYKR
jgi:hypothetical protein